MFHLTYESFVQYGSSNLKVLELTLGELQVSMYPSQGKKEEEKKKIELQKVVLFQLSVSS